MATTKTIYVAADGKEFDTEQDCNAHEVGLRLQVRIDEYIESAGLVKANAGFLRRHIPGFIAFSDAKDAKQAA
jgi:hypothetical protein